jgi:hypothetical protein
MMLEAIWYKDGKEIFRVDPVWEVSVEDDSSTLDPIKVHNGHYWYSAADCDETPDDFVIRIKKEENK